MNILTAINNEKIFKELKNKNNIKIISNNIQYKEGIIEILEKNNNVDFIIISENINGQIKIEELIKRTKKINSKINIIIILNKKDLIKEEYLIKNKIKFIYEEKITVEKITDKIFDKNRIIGILGSSGCGKTITTNILSELLLKYKDKKTLIIKDYEKDKIKIIEKINKIKNNYDYIFIDIQKLNNYKFYKEIIDENILILNPNILEINKIKKFIINNKIEAKTILNNYNENSISEEILKNIFKNKIKIIEKIENNKRYNLIINNNFDIKYLDEKTKKNFLNIIEKLKQWILIIFIKIKVKRRNYYGIRIKYTKSRT